MTQPPPNPPVLPFDQHGRYQMVAEALEAARPVIRAQLRVLDVGGLAPTLRGKPLLPGPLFLPADEVTTLDQPACDLPGYIQGDGRNLPFDDGSYDFVIACDVLEHVPAADRPAFLAELLRVARYGIAITAPFHSDGVVAAERLLAAYILAEMDNDQLQLREHRTFGWPALDGTAAPLAEL
ncbi:MAG TPA: class I SAM-dependent methyltransferase, partial [Roseiflexaceae bacterium]|nr:class I SAM-dependent methyltransferase [Roseiflexaceae bacterium]